jgi:Right handed beta helix region
MCLPGRRSQSGSRATRLAHIAWLVAMPALAVGCGTTEPAAPKPTTGTIAGTVTSSVGGAITGATVTVTPANGVALPSVTTTSAGAYTVLSVPVGSGRGAVVVTGVPSTCTSATSHYTGLTIGGTVTANVTVTCIPPPTAVASCGTIGAAGTYALTTNLQNAVDSVACITIAASNVVLQCAGDTITTAGAGIFVVGVENVTITNCVIVGTGNGIPALDIASTQGATISGSSVSVVSPGAIGIFMDGATNTTITNDTLLVNTQLFYSAFVLNSQQIAFTSNHITSYGPGNTHAGDAYIQDSSSGVTIANNVIADTGNGAGDIILEFGTNNTVRQNTIDGAWKGNLATWSLQGTDDGIVLQFESGDTIQDNTITNVFDAGFETVGLITNTVIAGNSFTNAGFTGIGGYHGTSWVGNTVLGNTVSLSPSLAYFFYGDNSTAYDGDSVTTIDFEGNTFSGNTFQNPSSLPPAQIGRRVASMVIDFAGLNEGGAPLPLPLAASNDTIAANQLPASIAGFFLFPPTAFFDGGGNTCNPSDPGTGASCSGVLAGLAPGSPLSRKPAPASLPPFPHLPPRPHHPKVLKRSPSRARQHAGTGGTRA